MPRLSQKSGLLTNGLNRVPAGREKISLLTNKDRKKITKLILLGHNKGFIDREVDDERVIWELNTYQDR